MNNDRQVTLQLKGVKRANAAGSGDDGSCGHIVNMRLKDGAWRLAGEKILSRTIEASQAIEVLNCENLLYHEDHFDGVIGSDKTTGDVIFFNFEDENKATLVDIDYAGGERVNDIRKFGKFLIVASNKDRYILKWDDTTNFYYTVPPLPRGQFAVWDDERQPQYIDSSPYFLFTSDSSTPGDDIIAELKKLIFDHGKEGLFEGHVFFRYAYRLFDNSLVNHSGIYYAHIGLLADSMKIVRVAPPEPALPEYGVFDYLMNNPLVEITFNPDELTHIESHKGIVKSIEVFMTAPITAYDFSINDFWNDWIKIDETDPVRTFYVPLKDSAKFDELFKNAIAFYKVASYDIEDILLWDEVESTGYRRKTDSLIIENIHAIETREAMEVDNFTHHRLSGSFIYDYNTRLHIADTVTRFADPINNGRKMLVKGTDDFNTAKRTLVFGLNMTVASTYVPPADFYLEVDIETEEGRRMTRIQVPDDKLNDYGINVFYDTSTGKYHIYLLEVVTYPDIRARYFRVCAKTGSTYMSMFGVELKEHQYLNCAYYQSQFYMLGNGFVSVNQFQVPDSIINDHTFRTIENTLRDTNRVQVSDLGNIFVYPARNSYRIGQKSNTVVALATMSSPMSEGQFGQFPIHVFTDAGIFNMNQGSGDVLYSNVQRLNLDALDGKDKLLEIGGALVYVSRGAIYLLTGNNKNRISQSLESKQDLEESSDDFGFPDGSSCNTAMTPITWDNFLSGMIMAYNHDENELVLSNSTSGISYVYQLVSGTWFMTDEAFKMFVMRGNVSWFGIKSNGDVHDITSADETDTYTNHVCFVTRPMLLGNRGLKKVSRIVGRMVFDVINGSSVMMAVYGSMNARDWTLLRKVSFNDGVNNLTLNDLMIKDTHSSAKYFIISFGAVVGNDFELTAIDLSVEDRFNRKLR